MSSVLLFSNNFDVPALKPSDQVHFFNETISKDLAFKDLHQLFASNDEERVERVFFNDEQKARFQVCKADKFLNKRYIAHLFGDSFMQNTIYEGWFVTDALLHMIAILQDNEISPEVSKVLKDLKNCLTWQERLISFSIANESLKIDDDLSNQHEIETLEEIIDLDEVNESEESQEKGLTPLQKIVGEFKEAIENLSNGEKIVVPGGCRGHSVLYEVQRVSKEYFQFSIYNAGEGVEKHNIIFEDEGIEKVHGVYRIKQIRKEKIINEKFLCDLFELKSIYPDNFGERLYEEILPTLEGVKEESSTNTDDYMLIQRSGTCSWKMLSAYLRYNMPLIQRKYIKLKARLDVFQKWYDLGYSLDCVKISQELLSRLIINYKGEIFSEGRLPMNFSREELLTMGIYKVKKTFNKYQFLLDDISREKADMWHKAFTGQTIYAA